MGILNTDDYADRFKKFDFATPDEIRQALNDPSAICIDVRTKEEIDATGKVPCNGIWKQTICNPMNGCRALEQYPELFIPAKDSLVFISCKSGRRAKIAKDTLESKGYKNVLNGGGLEDVKEILQQNKM